MIPRIFCFIVFLELLYFVSRTGNTKAAIPLNGDCTSGDSCVNTNMECFNSKCRCRFTYSETSGTCEKYGKKPFTKMRIRDSNISSIDIFKLWELHGVSCGVESEMFRNDQIDSIDSRCIDQAHIIGGAYQVDVTLSPDFFKHSSPFCESTYFSFNIIYKNKGQFKCFTNKDGFQLLYTSSDENKFYFGIYSPSESGTTQLFYADHENVNMNPASVIAVEQGVSTLDSMTLKVYIYDSPACQYTSSVNVSKCPTENGPPVIIPNQASYMEVRIKSNVSIECKYLSMTNITQLDWWFSGYSGPGEAKWMINNSEKYSEQEDVLTVYNFSVDVLTVYNFSVNDQGSYYCNVSNLFSSANSEDTKINLTEEIPNPTVWPLKYSTILGDNVSINCAIEVGYPDLESVWWEKNNTLVDTENTNLYWGNTSDPTLTISKTTFDSLGKYKCCGQNSAGQNCSDYVFLGAAPVITNITQTGEGLLGEVVHLTCHVKSIPDVDEVFLLKQTEMSLDTYNSSSPCQNQCSFDISNAQFADAGRYYCNASNYIGFHKSDPYDLKIYGIEIDIHSEDSVIYGNSITLNCTINSRPSTTIVQWFFNNTCVNRNPYTDPISTLLTIRVANFTNIGLYRCYAQNGKVNETSDEKHLDVIGDFPVVETGILSSDNPVFISVNQSDSVTLICNFTALPYAKALEWKRGENNLQISRRATGGSLQSPNLSFVDIDISDEDNYTCCVSNAVGTTCGPTIYLQVNSTVPMCPCSCEYRKKLLFWKNKNYTKEEMLKHMEPLMKDVQKELKLDKNKLSKTIRRKTSAPDDRKSAQQIGTVGVVFITVVFGLVIFIDIIAIKRFVQHIRGNFNPA